MSARKLVSEIQAGMRACRLSERDAERLRRRAKQLAKHLKGYEKAPPALLKRKLPPDAIEHHLLRLCWHAYSSPICAQAKAVFGALILHANRDGGGARPSYGTLAAMTGLSVASVQEYLSDIEAVCLLTRKSGDGRGHATDYALQIPPEVKSAATIGDIIAAQRYERAHTFADEKGMSGLTPLSEKVCARSVERYEPAQHKGMSRLTPTVSHTEYLTECATRAHAPDAPACAETEPEKGGLSEQERQHRIDTLKALAMQMRSADGAPMPRDRQEALQWKKGAATFEAEKVAS